MMRASRRVVTGVLTVAVAVASGCQSTGSKRASTVISPSPAVSDASDPDGAVAEKSISATPVRTAGVVERHPLFNKPREYYETSGDNKIVKVAAATFIGVPAGLVGEVKQIIVGSPPQTSY